MSSIKPFSPTLANIHAYSDACETAKHRAVIVLTIDKLRRQKLSLAAACETFHVPRSTYYRWRKTLFERGVYALRDHRKYTTRNRLAPAQIRVRALVHELRMADQNAGKILIWEKLKTHGLHVSISTVGRVISKLLHRGAIPPITSAQKAVRTKRRNTKRAHAQRIKKRIIATSPGQVLQVDTSMITTERRTRHHYSAVDPHTRIAAAMIFTRATAANAVTFLQHVKETFPYPIQAIQVDNGSEFKDTFETACQEQRIALFTIPPNTPKFNSSVERIHRTFKEQHYAMESPKSTIEEANQHLQTFTRYYNLERPHRALKLKSPMKHYNEQQGTSKMSQLP